MLHPDFSVFPILTTNRLLLRRIVATDANTILFLRSDEEVMQFIDKEKIKNVGEAVSLIQQIDNLINSNDGITWAICLSDQPDELIGTIGLWRIIKEHYRAEIGYMLHTCYWNKGIMKEAMQVVIEYGFRSLQLHSIEAHINPNNIASAKLLEKTGFVKEAHFKEDYYFKSKFLDTVIYSMLTNIH